MCRSIGEHGPLGERHSLAGDGDEILASGRELPELGYQQKHMGRSSLREGVFWTIPPPRTAWYKLVLNNEVEEGWLQRHTQLTSF